MIRKILLFAIAVFLVKGVVFTPPLWATSPLLQLQTDSSSVKRGEEFEAKIYLDTADQPTVGVDAILTFDPSFLKVKRIDEGSIYPNYPAKIYQNDTGIIKIAGSADYEDYFSGQGILATLLFEALKEGRTRIEFSWQPGGTRETNVVSPQKEDLLTSQPEGIEIEISSQTISQAILTPTPSAEPSPAPSPSFGLLETTAPPERPGLVESVTEIAEKIGEKIFPGQDKLVSPLPDTSSQVLGAQQTPSSKTPWILLSGFLLLATISLAIFTIKKFFL